MPGEKAVAAAAWALNVLSSVSLVMANKHLMSKYRVTFATSLTALHFMATAAIGGLRTRKSRGTHGGGPARGSDSAPPHGSSNCSEGVGSQQPLEAQKRSTDPPESEQVGSSLNGAGTPGLLDQASADHPSLPPMSGVGAAQYLLSLVVPNSELAWELLAFGVIADVSIASMNFSLMLNSIGFYQISKLSVLPAVCFIEGVLLGKRFSVPALLSVAVVTVGVGICTTTDFYLNFTGCAVAAVAITSTALQQVLIGTLQRRHGMTSFDLLSNTAPIQAGLLLLLGPACDKAISGVDIFQFPFSAHSLGAIGLTCLLAMLCNVSQYMCLGRFSATSFQVLGNMKTVFVLFFGWLVLTLGNVVGMVTAMVGMMSYSWIVQREKSKVASVKKLN